MKELRESIKQIVEHGGNVELPKKSKGTLNIWKSDIRLDYWVNHKSFSDIDEAINYYIKELGYAY